MRTAWALGGLPAAGLWLRARRVGPGRPEVDVLELGRNLPDDEGSTLIRDWIASLPRTCS